MTKQTSKQNITRDIEIKNKLTVTRGEEREEIKGENKGRVINEHVLRTHGQSQSRVGSRVGGGDGCSGWEWWGENGDDCI